jgi:hypothetical protein
MSMMGRFVQVSPDRLKQIIDDPSDVEELFAGEQAAKAVPTLMGALQARMRALTPQKFAESMAAMPEPVRDRLAQSLKNLGLDPEALARGEGGDELAKLMAQRLQMLGSRMPGRPPASGGAAAVRGPRARAPISHSTRRGTECITSYAASRSPESISRARR